MSVRNRLRNTAARGEKAVGLFLTCGYPNPEATGPILDTLADSGADFIELGMPFSDPVAEGIPIQRASQVALSYGISLRDVLKEAERFRDAHDIPLVLMGYANPLHRYGIESFCRDATAAGVDGLIVTDLSLEGSALLERPAASSDLELVYLVAPSPPPERVAEIDSKATGFVYAVSTSALTGDRLDDLSEVHKYLYRLRREIRNNPLLVGFGIDRHDLGMSLSENTDGFIVGSALIRRIEELWEQGDLSEIDRLSEIARFTTSIKFGPNAR